VAGPNHSDIRQASLYPAICVSVVCAFVLFLFTYIIPKFASCWNRRIVGSADGDPGHLWSERFREKDLVGLGFYSVILDRRQHILRRVSKGFALWDGLK